MCSRTERGQAVVEAAVMIPVLFVVMLMLLQPSIILYDRLVMADAAAEGCRLLATRCADGGYGDAQYEEIVKRHLGAVPQQDLFHIHDGGCTWHVELSGDEHSGTVSVTIENQVKLLPLFDAAGALTNLAPDGRYTIRVQQQAQTKPVWYGN